MSDKKVILEIHYDSIARIIREFYGNNINDMRNQTVCALVNELEDVGDLVKTKVTIKRRK